MQQVCGQCEEVGNVDYCNVCDAPFCARCWQQQFSHKNQRLAPGSIPHEKSDFITAKKIRAILEPGNIAEKQDILHEADEDTTWFGIETEDGELPVFQDYGKYARIMADTQSSFSGQDSSWSTGIVEHRYPSLVSFVGQTGRSPRFNEPYTGANACLQELARAPLSNCLSISAVKIILVSQLL